MILTGDCLEILRGFPAECIDAVVSDPPYGLSREPDMAEVVRHWCAAELRDHALACGLPAAWADRLFPDTPYEHGGAGFMGKTWDSFVPGPHVWREVLRVMKPGAHAVVFSGTRTYDLTVLAMRIAGFEIRDQAAWMYGTGFPKSLDVSKAIDAAAGAAREVVGPGRWNHVKGDNAAQAECLIRPGGRHVETAPATADAQRWVGWGTALKPAQEPIVIARKPLAGTVAANVLAHGTGGINVDACRIGTEVLPAQTAGQAQIGTFERGVMVTPERVGRWPANVLLDEAAAAALDAQSGTLTSGKSAGFVGEVVGSVALGRKRSQINPATIKGDTGGASRFFYVAKASKAEREAGLLHLPVRSGGELTDRQDGSDGLKSPRAGAGRGGGRRNHHPTVKPIELMRYLVRLVTPPGGFVLDPYAGSGTTGIAAALEGARFVGCELDPEFAEIARARIEHWVAKGRAA